MDESDIQAPHFWRGALMLFETAHAVQALAELERAGAWLLGADRLILLDDGIQPVGEIDVSPGGTDAATYERVRAFLCRDNDRARTVYELVWD